MSLNGGACAVCCDVNSSLYAQIPVAKAVQFDVPIAVHEM